MFTKHWEDEPNLSSRVKPGMRKSTEEFQVLLLLAETIEARSGGDILHLVP